jgi:hypothetical protein
VRRWSSSLWITRAPSAPSENIDDSDGYCTALLTHAQRIHLAACRTAKPDPLARAPDLFLRETEGTYDTFFGAAAQYAEGLGEEGLAEFRRLAREAWDKLPARIGPRRSVEEYGFDDFGLMTILDLFAERDGDVDTRIALRAKNLSSPWAYLQLAEFCQAQGQEEEALRRVEEGLWLFEDDRPDERLVSFAEKEDRKADATGASLARLREGAEPEPLGSAAHTRRPSGCAARYRPATRTADWLPSRRWPAH